MTEPERRALREAIDRARRVAVKAPEAVYECLHCGSLFIPTRSGQRFCRKSHRVNYHRKTDRGRAMFNAYRRRVYRARKQRDSGAVVEATSRCDPAAGVRESGA